MSRGPRLYQNLVRCLASDIAEGKYPIGTRLPAERHLVQLHSVSGATLRRALITLEAQGVIEIRYGAGAYVARRPGAKKAPPNSDLTAFEISEAGLIFEAEVAGLAATQIALQETKKIARLVETIGNKSVSISEERSFHLAVARATRNRAIVELVKRIWDLRAASRESALLDERVRSLHGPTALKERRALVAALERRDSAAACTAMKSLLSGALESLLAASEEMAIVSTRHATAAKLSRLDDLTDRAESCSARAG